MSDVTFYAIGDVHGEIAKLDRLLHAIRADAVRREQPHRIVFLGDLIDRGPDSRAVVARAMHLAETEGAIALRGNHEQLMLHAFDNRESVGIYWWAENGGDETIAAYKRANGDCGDWRDAIDAAHLAWLRALPCMARETARGLVFVHAGIDPWRFPDCSEEVKLWTRSASFFRSHDWPERAELEGLVVVHGHTPTEDFEPELQPRRINVDTGACFGGPLTCAVLGRGEAPRFLHA